MHTPPSDKLTIFACPKTHDQVVALFERFPKGRVLDMGAGEGALSRRLQEAGFEVRALDLMPERFRAAGIACDRGDLNRTMPYRADSFDYLCGVELIEHLEDPFDFIRECRRILRPGGKLVLTTPNMLNLASRIKYLLTGFYPLTTRPLNECTKSPVWDHIHPLTYYQLRYMLHTNGFHIERVDTDRYRSSAAYWLWLYPLLRLFTRTTMRKERDPGQRARNREIRRTMHSPALLLGRTVIVTAEKEGG
ncbi:MAG: methyltransferase domain-containing protein [Candidatus Latescibacteria bacterium]|nr:methyltransferase domain-containing protein [Candidatus Latescibacterota bacterium]